MTPRLTPPRHVTLIGAPYHLGRHAVGMGGGPEVLLAEDAAPRRLADAGIEISVSWIAQPAAHASEVARTFEVNRLLAKSVKEVRAAGAFPLVSAGNCNACLGVLGGIEQEGLGIVWFDAHADFNTPETTLSGFFDGMGLAIATGSCWRALRRSIPGFREVAEDLVVLAGVRDLEPREEERLRASAINVVGSNRIRDDGVARALAPELDRLRSSTQAVYLHVDLDVLDPGEGRANEYAAPGGLSLDQLTEAIAAVGERFTVQGAAVTAYDPDCDEGGRMRATALELISAVVSSVGPG